MLVYQEYSCWSPTETALNCRDDGEDRLLRTTLCRLKGVARVYLGEGGRFTLRFPDEMLPAVKRTLARYE